ncbi:MAG: hypothetical protein CSB33_03330 [Desulfobacterales bacterium]|nr:MAG: hypothetical protein CSB33_03330 [Desulfobacterales bacterium]
MTDELRQKKMAAAIAGVTTYIKSIEEAAAAAMAGASEPKPQTPWGVSHRADMMQFRNLMQLKAFHGVYR